MNDFLPQPIPGNGGPDRIHEAEQLWAQANEHLTKVLAYGESMRPTMAANAQGNQDISAIYDWWKAYVQIAEQIGGKGAHDMTILMCAAAITRLMHSAEYMEASSVLAQLEKDM